MSDQPRQQTGNVSQLPAKGAFRALRDCKTLAEAFESKELRDRIAAAAPRHLDPDTLLRTFIQACGKTPLIYKCDMRQALGAFMSLSYLGLPPGTVLGLSHLIPFAKTKWNPATRKREPDGYDLQVIIGYQGYVELAFRSGFIRDLASGVVYPGDHFDFERGSKRFLTHKQSLDIDPNKMIPRAAYAIASFTNEGEEFEVMSWLEVERIRNRSQAYRTALAAKEKAETDGKRLPQTWTEAPWVRDPGEMARKTAIRRLAKLLPKSPELMAGIGLEDAADAGKKLDFGPVIDGTATPMDGIPEVRDEQDEGAEDERTTDAGAAHTDRRPPPVEPSNDQQKPKPRAQRQQARTGETQASSPKPPPVTTPAPESPPAFETVLISAFGEPGETFTDPVAFARALVLAWRAADRDGQANLTEHNADAIDTARTFAGVPGVLAALDEEPPPTEDPDDPGPGYEEQTGDESGPVDSSESGGEAPVMTFTAIRPIVERGKAQWGPWLNALRDDLATIGLEDLLAWTDTQRDVLAEAPLAQRALAVKAITGRFAETGRTPPGYLADLITAKSGGLSQAEKDEKWLADREADMAGIEDTIEGRRHFDLMVGSTATQTVMARLRTDNAALFNRARDAFNAKNRDLPPAPGTPAGHA